MEVPDDGIVFALDRKKVIGYASLADANRRLNDAITKLDNRMDNATEQILIQMRTIEQQDMEIEHLHSLLDQALEQLSWFVQKEKGQNRERETAGSQESREADQTSAVG